MQLLAQHLADGLVTLSFAVQTPHAEAEPPRIESRIRSAGLASFRVTSVRSSHPLNWSRLRFPLKRRSRSSRRPRSRLASAPWSRSRRRSCWAPYGGMAQPAQNVGDLRPNRALTESVR